MFVSKHKTKIKPSTLVCALCCSKHMHFLGSKERLNLQLSQGLGPGIRCQTSVGPMSAQGRVWEKLKNKHNPSLASPVISDSGCRDPVTRPTSQLFTTAICLQPKLVSSQIPLMAVVFKPHLSQIKVLCLFFLAI